MGEDRPRCGERSGRRWFEWIPLGIVFIFTIGSALYLLIAGSISLVTMYTDPSQTVNHHFMVIYARHGGGEWSVPGLAYRGIPGHWLKVGEGAALAIAFVLLLHRVIVSRIVGLLIVTVWAALWAWGGIGLLLHARSIGWIGALCVVPLLATLVCWPLLLRRPLRAGVVG